MISLPAKGIMMIVTKMQKIPRLNFQHVLTAYTKILSGRTMTVKAEQELMSRLPTLTAMLLADIPLLKIGQSVIRARQISCQLFHASAELILTLSETL